jgi:hypothetical protein
MSMNLKNGERPAQQSLKYTRPCETRTILRASIAAAAWRGGPRGVAQGKSITGVRPAVGNFHSIHCLGRRPLWSIIKGIFPFKKAVI